jgi:hypothetical protein
MAETTKQLSFIADQQTLELIESLKKELGAPTAAAVFRKALIIAKLAADQARGSDGVVRFRGKDQPQSEEIALALRA